MKRFSYTLAVFAIITCVFGASCNKHPRDNHNKAGNPFIGTWELVSAIHDGSESNLSNRYTIHKHITPTHFIWVWVDPNTETIEMSCSGTYSFTEKTFTGQTTYGYGRVFRNNRNKTNTLSWRIDENKWYHEGRLENEAIIKEVWQRVEVPGITRREL